MQKRMVLVIYTSHRADCLRLCLDCLSANTRLSRFHKIFIFANALPLDHLLLAASFCERVPCAELVPCTPRGLVPAVMEAMNQVLEEYRDDLILKIDEDVFVTPGWLDALLESYEEHKDREDVLMTSALCPISVTGYSLLQATIESRFQDVYRRYQGCHAPLNKNKTLHRYVWEMVLEGGLEEAFRETETAKYLYITSAVINCILFDSRLTDKIYPLPLDKDPETGMACVDELAICRALRNNNALNAVPAAPFVHHYSHWRSEEYLRRHVPLSRVRRFMLERGEVAVPEMVEAV